VAFENRVFSAAVNDNFLRAVKNLWPFFAESQPHLQRPGKRRSMPNPTEGAGASATVVGAHSTAVFLLECSRAPDRFFYPCNAKARAPRSCIYRLRRPSVADRPIQVFIAECDYVQGGTGWRVWPCALLLSAWIAANHEELSLGRLRVIELGSGLGLPGLVSAALGARAVRITDCLPLLLTTMRQSAAAAVAAASKAAAAEAAAGGADAATETRAVVDSDSAPGSPASSLKEALPTGGRVAGAAGCTDVEAALLDWDDLVAPEEGEVFSTEQGVKAKQLAAEVVALCGVWRLDDDDRFELLLGSDVVYSHSHARQLPAVLAARASPSGALACFMVPVRSKEHTRCFLSSLDEQGFNVRVSRVDAPWIEAVVSTQMDQAEAGGWTEHTAGDGRTFYHSAATGKSRWRRPAEMDVRLPYPGAPRPRTRASGPYSSSLVLTEGEILFVEAEKTAER